MTRPDPRLLVSIDSIPEPPDGARVWPRLSESAIYLAAHKGEALIWHSLSDYGWFCASSVSLDLSVPALRPDGHPERLDVLPWAMAVLGFDRVNVESPTSAIVRFRDEGHDAGGRFRGMVGIGATAADLVALGELETAPTSPGLDLSGLSPDDAARAVVAAALREVGRG